jgi:hypothetical protein
MSIAFRCPECQEDVKVSATLAGMHTPCPSCYVSVVVPAVTVRADVGVDDRPSTEIHVRGDVLFHMAPTKENLPAAWRWVMTGLGSILVGATLWLLIVLLVGISFFTTALADRLTAFPVVSSLLSSTANRAIDLLLPASVFLLLVGWLLCLAVPRDAQSRRWVVVGWVGILAAGLVVTGYLITAHRRHEGMPALEMTAERLDFALGAVVLALHLVLGVFLSTVASFLQMSALPRQGLLFTYVFAACAIVVGVADAIVGGKGVHLLGTAGYVLWLIWLEYALARITLQIWREV